MNYPLLELSDIISPGIDLFEGARGYVATGDLSVDKAHPNEFVTFDNRPSRANQSASEGDVLFARMAETNKVLHVNGEEADLIFSTGFCVLRPRKHLLAARYLYHYIRSAYFQREKDRHCTGATQKAITNAKIEKLSIPLCGDTVEQDRIAAILDKADAIRRKRQQAIELTNEFLRSVFLDMFGDPAKNPKGWQTKRIGQLGKVVTGNTPSRQIRENYGDHIEWIKSDNINTPSHILTIAEEGLSETGEKLGRTVPANSTLVTCIAGTPECIGNAALTDRKVAFNQQINAIVPFENVDPYFLYVLVIMSKKIVQSASTNSMKGMVSKGIFQEIEMISPPHDLQRRFGRYFYAYLKYIDKQKLHLIESDNLFNSLCQKAFRGEL